MLFLKDWILGSWSCPRCWLLSFWVSLSSLDPFCRLSSVPAGSERYSTRSGAHPLSVAFLFFLHQVHDQKDCSSVIHNCRHAFQELQECFLSLFLWVQIWQFMKKVHGDVDQSSGGLSADRYKPSCQSFARNIHLLWHKLLTTPGCPICVEVPIFWFQKCFCNVDFAYVMAINQWIMKWGPYLLITAKIRNRRRVFSPLPYIFLSLFWVGACCPLMFDLVSQ